MNILANYVMNLLYEENGKEDLIKHLNILQYLFDRGDVDKDTEVERSYDGIKFTIKSMLLDKCNGDFYDEIVSFLKNNKMVTESSEKESYIALLNTIKNINYNDCEEEIKEKIETFLNLNIEPEKIVSYMQANDNNTKNRDLKDRSKNFFDTILSKKGYVYIFKSITRDYLSFEDIKDALEKYLIDDINMYQSNFRVRFTHGKVSKIIELCNVYPDLRQLNLNRSRSKYNAETLENFLMRYFPDFVYEKMENTENDRERLVNYYYERGPQNDYFSNVPVKTITSRKDWFSTCLKDEKKDMVSLFSSGSSSGIEFILYQIKNEEFKNYLIKRKANLIVEFISNNPEKYLNLYLENLKKDVPELLNRENELGVFNLIFKNKQTRSMNPKYLNIIRDFPSVILMTSDEEELLNFANNNHFVDPINMKEMHKEDYKVIYNMIISSIRENFKGRFTDKVEESLLKLKIKYDISTLIDSNFRADVKDSVEEIEKIFDDSGLSLNKIEQMESLKTLLSNGKISEDYIVRKKAYEEKNLLLSSVNSVDIMKIRKRV